MPRFDKAPPRPANYGNRTADSPAPGQYDDGKRFNSNIKPITIGKRRNDPRTTKDENPGAGNYNPERGEMLTKPKVPGVDMGKSPSRP